ncbi:stage V sporulation protein AD, partial [Coprococcus sp. MSK.21.13]|nr:stage V sporulation protein AD [Coprococcus sp. MSK.21.13]
MSKKIGKQTLKLDTKPRLISTYSIVGPKEGEGPLNMYFDKIIQD